MDNIKNHIYSEIKILFSLDRYIVLSLFTIIFANITLVVATGLAKTNSTFSNSLVYIQEEIYFLVDDIGVIEADALFSTSSNTIFWFVLGSIIYILCWLAIVALVDTYNNILVSKIFIHPSSYHQSTYWTAIIGRVVFKFATFLLFLLILLWTYKTFIPWSLSLIILSLNSTWVSIIASIIQIMLATFFLLYVYTISLRILFFKKRILN